MIQINPNRTIENNFPDSTPKTATDKFDTIDGGLVNSLTVEMTPVQDLHGYDKPWPGGAEKNILITNLSDVKANNTNGVWSGDVYTYDGIEFEVLSDVGGNVVGIKVTRITSSVNNIAFNITMGSQLNNLVNKNIIMNGAPADSNYDCFLQFYLYDGTNVISAGINADSNAFTPTSGMTASSAVRIVVRTSTNPNGVIFKPMIRLASIADPTFEPYSNICPISGHTEAKSKINNTVYTTSLGGTEYGGEVEQVSGEGEVTYGVTDLGTASFTYYGDGLFGITNNTIKPETHINIICSCYKSYAGINNITGTSTAKTYMSDGDIASKEGSKEIFIKDTRYSDADVLKAALSGQSVVYELATPSTLTLTGQNITAEVGENNVSAPLDGQEIQTDGVTYKEMFSWADVVAYVQSQVNP